MRITILSLLALCGIGCAGAQFEAAGIHFSAGINGPDLELKLATSYCDQVGKLPFGDQITASIGCQ